VPEARLHPLPVQSRIAATDLLEGILALRHGTKMQYQRHSGQG
jgi:hypothetical protein